MFKRLVLGTLVATLWQPLAASADTASFSVDVRSAGPVMQVDMIGNATRLNNLLGLKSAAALPSAGGDKVELPSADFFRTRYPHYRQFRIGNLFVGYRCTELDFDELAVRGPDGRLRYQFGQTLEMLQIMLAAGIKPHLALTGTPSALVPAGEAPLKHPNYGCVNAPALDLSKAGVRERAREWWQMQDAFLGALIERFGKAEVQSWTFATWTEPMNHTRKLAHLVLPRDIVQAGRHDEAVATLLAASIDAAMQHGLKIRLGNLSGAVQTEYPAIVAQIARLPRGREYLNYVDGFAISRYRSQPRADIGRQLDAAFGLLDNPAMLAKPLFIDEVGDLAGVDGADPFPAAAGLQSALFMARVLERVYSRQDGSARRPGGVAFWRDQIEPRPRNVFSRPEIYLKSAASQVTDMFVSLNGHARLTVSGPQHQAVAGVRGGQVKAILVGAPEAEAGLDGPAMPQTRTFVVKGLRPDAAYSVTLTEIGRVRGNPISAFLDGAPGYQQDRQGRFKSEGGKWALASPKWTACFYEEDSSCAWRQKAREVEAPLVRGSTIRADRGGQLDTSMVVDAAAIVMVDVVAAR